MKNKKRQVMKDAKGRFMKGYSANPAGRPKGTSFMDEYVQALRETEKNKRKSLLRHFIEKAYEDNRVLIAAVDKILPSLKAIDMQVEETMSDQQAALIREQIRKKLKCKVVKHRSSESKGLLEATRIPTVTTPFVKG
ncbi:MAG: DUF5681 domain-containing protein [Planctomycetota bacterium]|jgi:hypothetical protein